MAIAMDTAANGSGQSLWLMLIYMAVIFGIMYFLLIRPQRKKQKEEDKMRNNIQIGDEIITIGGIYGRVVAVKEDSFIIESGPDRSKYRMARWAIQTNLTVHADDDASADFKKK